MKYLAAFLTLLIAAAPVTANAQRSGGFHGGGARPSAPSRPSNPGAGGAAARAPSGGGFNFNRDTTPSRPNPPNTNNVNRNNVNRNNVNTNNVNRNNVNTNNINRNNVNTNNINRNNVNTNNINRNNVNVNNRNVNVNNVNRNVVVANPIYRGPAWGWNHGVAWYPAPAYWGGGFWGAMAIGVTSAAVFGAIVSNNVRYTSYQIQPSSPGATLLNNYHLTQTQCGPPNLVVIYGPNNSVICAYPNDIVSAGNYNLDTSTLSLTSQ